MRTQVGQTGFTVRVREVGGSNPPDQRGGPKRGSCGDSVSFGSSRLWGLGARYGRELNLKRMETLTVNRRTTPEPADFTET